MEVLNFIKEYWPILAGITAIVTAFYKLGLKQIKQVQAFNTELISAKMDVKFKELRGDVTSEINMIKVRLETLCEHVAKQNGRLDRAENWQREHVEDHHLREN